MSQAAAPHTMADAQVCPWPDLGRGILEDVASVRAEVAGLKQASESREQQIRALTDALEKTCEELAKLRGELSDLRRQGAVTSVRVATIIGVGGAVIGWLVGWVLR